MSSRECERELTDILRRSGVEWTLEIGGKHRKLRVRGTLVLVLPRAGQTDNWRRRANAVACLVRHLRSIGVDTRNLR